MKCPHCLVAFTSPISTLHLGNDPDGSWSLSKVPCPACEKLILYLEGRTPWPHSKTVGPLKYWALVRPKASARPPCPVEVPASLAGDYTEACLVLPDSPKSAAALGRRCLQNFLHERMGIQGRTLSNEIDVILETGGLPTGLRDSVDAIRVIGNFAAHPLKSEQSGLILDVEAGEAEWTLEVLEELFDFYFVRPGIIDRKRAALNAKLADAGKPEMK